MMIAGVTFVIFTSSLNYTSAANGFESAAPKNTQKNTSSANTNIFAAPETIHTHTSFANAILLYLWRQRSITQTPSSGECKPDQQGVTQIFGNKCLDMRIFTKKPVFKKITAILGELNSERCDCILFSEKCCALGDAAIHGGHTWHTNREPTHNAGDAISLHDRHVPQVVRVTHVCIRLLVLDSRIGDKIYVRFVVVYTPHAGYSHCDLERFYDDVHACLEDARRPGYNVILGANSTHNWM